MTPGRSEFISSGKFSVGYYGGWYVQEWAELPTPTVANPEEKTWMWARWPGTDNPLPGFEITELSAHNRASNLIVRNLFRQLTGVEICKWDMCHSEAA